MLMYAFLHGVFVVICFFLIALVLMQKGKGGAGLFGSMASTQMKIFGASGQDIFQKTTWVAMGLMMALALGMSVGQHDRLGGLASSLMDEALQAEDVLDAASMNTTAE